MHAEARGARQPVDWNSAAEPDGAQTSESTVTRASLARSVQRAIGVSKGRASNYVEQLFEEIFECLVNGEEVKLSAFGNFSVRKKRERDGRNPKTGAKATIKARRVVVFRPSQILRARIEANSRDR
jgi:integration host factor subunit alpha